jgi:hypothetical protein
MFIHNCHTIQGEVINEGLAVTMAGLKLKIFCIYVPF